MTTTGTVVVISVFLEELIKLTHHPKNTYKASILESANISLFKKYY